MQPTSFVGRRSSVVGRRCLLRPLFTPTMFKLQSLDQFIVQLLASTSTLARIVISSTNEFICSCLKFSFEYQDNMFCSLIPSPTLQCLLKTVLVMVLKRSLFLFLQNKKVVEVVRKTRRKRKVSVIFSSLNISQFLKPLKTVLIREERTRYTKSFLSEMTQTLPIRACLHEGGGPQVGEVTCGGLPHLSCKRDHINMRDCMDRRVTPPKRVTSPISLVLHLHVNRPLRDHVTLKALRVEIVSPNKLLWSVLPDEISPV